MPADEAGSGSARRRTVGVFAEHADGQLARVSLELLGRSRDLARAMEGEVWAFLLGSGVAHLSQELIGRGADRVLVGDVPVLGRYDTSIYCQVVSEMVREHRPDILLMGATDLGRDLAPRIAARIGTGLTADCVGLDIQPETGLLLQTKRGYSGNIVFSFVCPNHRPQMATVRPGVFKSSPRDDSRRGEVIRMPVSVSDNDRRVRVVKESGRQTVGGGLEDARVVVGCGRGVGTPENFRRLVEIAESMGGAVAVTKEIVDAGWISEGHMVGQTGKVVRPDLYIACGLSGAVQHTSGMWDSGVIVAINKDPKAEIFQIADYGIVADLNEVIPAFVEEMGGGR
ncbi:MAG: electron transfer flavoprotein subunit alpha/FixB family protein [Chloroflexi bacterium]|nr:electron transfer flavoprotein subunit alpha/FixB family protein [Chloroflexota bacterium]